jgi:hypothetical protein
VSILLFLNELSCGTPQPPERVNEAMAHLVDVLRHVRRQRPEASLVLPVKKEELELAAGYYVQQWINADRRNPDRWNLIREMRSRSPYGSVLPAGAAEGTEYRIGGKEAKGAGAADLLNGLLVSLPVDAAWDRPWVEASCDELDGTDGSILTRIAEIRHAAKADHAARHDDWIRQDGLSGFRSGAEIWAAWPDLYPNLERLPSVEEHLRDLRADWVVPVAWRLRTLNDAAAHWDPASSKHPDDWGSKVTVEGEQRKLLCWFTDLDGRERLFDLHARVTPGHGRIHLRLVPESGMIRIAYIGLKLGI